MDIQIEFATEEDLPQLTELLAELFALERDFQPDREKQLRGLRLILNDPAIGRLFVLRVDGKVTGMANALITISTAEGGPVVLLEDIIINGTYRGMGLGRRLFDHVVAWAQGQGMKRVTLLADGDNRSALAFYNNLEFELSNMVVLRKPLV
jgi:GNAT superfamily N-acetyltransferase